MSQLGAAVADQTGRGAGDVETVLIKHQISTSASRPSPARLQFTRLRFNGTKQLTGVTPAGEKVDKDHREEVPFTFDWSLTSGLLGVGSDENLRGKSSLLRILMWALRGRCDLKNEVRSWIDHVQVDLSVDDVRYEVTFDVDHEASHAPRGSLLRFNAGGVPASVGQFENDEQFEEIMGGAMMTALRLPTIAATQEGRRTQHAWPTYAGALVVRGDTLNFLLGEHAYAGLPGRLLSLFVGAEWAAARAEAASAFTVAQADLKRLEDAAEQHAQAMGAAHGDAVAAVEAAQTRLDGLPTSTDDIAAVNAALDRISVLNRETNVANDGLLGAKSSLAVATAQFLTEEARRSREIDDAKSVKFFQQLRPNVCPRCAAPVTEERRAAEDSGDSCSVCVSDLALDAHQEHLVLALSVPEAERQRLERDIREEAPESAADDEELDDADLVDDLEALSKAVAAATVVVGDLEAELATLTSERGQLTELVEASSAARDVAEQRRAAEIELARAEGAAAALEPADGPVGPDQATIDGLRQDIQVLDAARAISAEWVREGQRQWLADVAEDITNLARDFGVANLTGVTLGGNATMKVTQGGTDNNYGDCERGEKLRLKLATAIALIKQGRTSGVGRHPGLLFVDSPGSEEVTDDDFDSMLEALHREAQEADIQVLVGTRHTQELVALLGESRCRLGRGTNFVW